MKINEIQEIVNGLLERIKRVKDMEMSESMKFFLEGRKSAFNELYGILDNLKENEE